jgi:dTDP-4-amino-4,6-dideoxygalactose transaminase
MWGSYCERWRLWGVMESNGKKRMQTIPFCRVTCDGNELRYVQEVLESGWLTTAAKAMALEKLFAAQVGARYACAVNSATAALHLACEAVGVRAGDKVFVPTMTFTASAEVVRYLGADPVLLDVEYGTCLVTPEILARAIQKHPDVKALVLVHYGGQAAEMGGGDSRAVGRSDSQAVKQSASQAVGRSDSQAVKQSASQAVGRSDSQAVKQSASQAVGRSDSQAVKQSDGQTVQLPDLSSRSPGILDICRKHGIKLIEDAAHAFPTRHGGRMVGSFGDVTCFSFYANKTITTGEGGMLVTDNEEIYKRCKIMRLHGINRDIWDRFTAKKVSWEYDVVAPGYKYNMPDVNAAIGLAQLERAEKLRQGRQHCAETYLKQLAGLPGVDLPVCKSAREDHAWHLFPLVLTKAAKIPRQEFIERMSAAGIGTSVHYKPLHRMTYYRETYDLSPDDFPVAERIWQGTVSLPIFPSMTDDELQVVCETIRGIEE